MTIGREKKRRETATKSDTATTLAEKLSTELQLLSPDGAQDGVTPAPHANNKASTPSDNLNSDDKHGSDTYETTIFHFNRPHTENDDEETMFCDTGTGVSSFLPHPPLRRNNGKQQNAESAYSSFDDEQADTGDYSELLYQQQTVTNTLPNANISINDNAHLVKQNSIDDERRRPSDLPSQNSVHHYKMNDQDYAVVTKISGQRNQKHLKHPPDSRQCVIDTTKQVQISSHIHAVPEDIYSRDHVSPTTMHLIPEHDCLLHKIPPPPPPPVRIQDWDSPSRNTWTSTQADV